MAKRKAYLLALVTVLVLACGSAQRPAEPVVTGKEHVPASSRLLLLPAGKSFVPIRQNRPERFELRLRGCFAPADCVDWTESVSQDVWDALDVGDRFIEGGSR